MAITKQVRLPSPAIQKRLERGVTRQQDMPKCVDCETQITGAAIAGFDGRWRCLKHNELHNEAVLQESGDSAPNESENIKHFAARVDEAKEKARKKKADAMLEKYGVGKRPWS
jgi:hypothetical protein